MASLALIVSLMLLFILISGPLIFLITKLNFLPILLTNILAAIILLIGLWWIITIPTFARYFSLPTIYFSWLSIKIQAKAA
jgi:hypothetical protein